MCLPRSWRNAPRHITVDAPVRGKSPSDTHRRHNAHEPNEAADRERTRSLAAAMTAAVLFLFLLTSVPYAGAPLLLLAMLFGIGAIVLALFSHAHSETLQPA